MNILVIGAGAREHSLVWKLGQSPKLTKLYAAPGNGGTALMAENLPIPPTDIPALERAAVQKKIDLAVVGPEAPLAAGIVDSFEARGVAVFGPTREATRIESSKVFAKDLMHRYGIPCARSRSFTSYPEAERYVRSQQPPVVIKGDGLAGGKGAVVASTTEEALHALQSMMVNRTLGSAGDRVVVEECLQGKEVSLLGFTDGKTVVPMVPACDYKRVFDGDLGPNTGGMGAYSPPGFFDAEMTRMVKESILQPTVRAMANEGKLYKGVLYAGLMITDEGPKVLEFNARFGDPENQVMMPRLETDLVDIMLAVISGKLHEAEVEWSEEACVGVVMASGGYPGSYVTGFPITGLDRLDEGILVFHAGTEMVDGLIRTDGGRVLTVVAEGNDVGTAREKVYASLPRIRFQACHYRRDIALREVS